jgi:hypothetical protein
MEIRKAGSHPSGKGPAEWFAKSSAIEKKPGAELGEHKDQPAEEWIRDRPWVGSLAQVLCIIAFAASL